MIGVLTYASNYINKSCFRLLWTVVFLTLLASMFIFFKESYETYTNNPISFVTETTYLEWNTTFPAITICEVSSSEVFWTP